MSASRDPRNWGSALLKRSPILIVLVVLVVLATILSDGVFIHTGNLSNLLYQASVVGVLATGQGLVIIAAGLDLSVGVTAVFTALLIGGTNGLASTGLPTLPLVVSLLLGLAAGAAIGLINGIASTRSKVPSFIVTLATLFVLVGFAEMITNGRPVQPHPAIADFGDAKLWIIPAPVFLWLGVVLVVAFLVSRTTYGAKLYAAGGAETAASLAGVNVPRIKTITFVISGVLATIAGVILLARTGQVVPGDGGTTMLDSIAAVVVGGVALRGGRGTIIDVFLGVLVLALISNVMNILLISPYIQSAVKGAIILAAVGLNAQLARARGFATE